MRWMRFGFVVYIELTRLSIVSTYTGLFRTDEWTPDCHGRQGVAALVTLGEGSGVDKQEGAGLTFATLRRACRA